MNDMFVKFVPRTAGKLGSIYSHCFVRKGFMTVQPSFNIHKYIVIIATNVDSK